MQKYRKIKEGNTVEIFSHSFRAKELRGFILDNGTIAEMDMSGYEIKTLSPYLYSSMIQMPKFKCVVCFIFCDNVLFLRVGKPDIHFYLYTQNEDEKILPYRRYDHNNNTIEDGILENYGFGFYGFKPTDANYSIIETGNTINALDYERENYEDCPQTRYISRNPINLSGVSEGEKIDVRVEYKEILNVAIVRQTMSFTIGNNNIEVINV